jgi:hypothetical protein
MSIARYYDKEKNAEGASLPGVPLRDLTDEEFEAYPKWLQASIDATPFFRKSNPSPARRSKAGEGDTPEKEG